METNLSPDDLIKLVLRSLRNTLSPDTLSEAIIVGIRTGGLWVAERLHQELASPQPLGELNINFYRDDFSRRTDNPVVQPSVLPPDLDGHTVILVDDVIYTGRTIRAAMNELFDYGRPQRILLVSLIDRGGREIPVQPDITGMKIEMGSGHQIKLDGPEPLSIKIVSKEA